MPVERSPARQHFTTIDALRGFAALSVCLFHLGGTGLAKLSSPLTASMTSWGWTGVEVFFVISGFVIPYVLLRGDYRWSDAGLFLSRRFVRIWPPSAVIIVLTIAQYAVANRAGLGDPEGWTALDGGRIVANLAYAVPFTNETWLNGILWTLSVEFQYYLVLALIFPWLVARRHWLIVALLVSMLSGLMPFAEDMQFLKYAIYFAMGGLVLIYREGQLGRWVMLCLLAVMTTVAILQLGALPSFFAAATALIIAFVPVHNRPLIFLGTISYSLYLTHLLIASTAEFVLLKLGPDTPIEKLLAQFVCLAATIIGAWIFYHLVERHFVTWSQRLVRSGECRPPIEPAPQTGP